MNYFFKSSKALNVYLDALENIVNAKKDYSKRNVVDIELSRFRTMKSQNSLFTHELPVIFKVNAAYLWETARSYLFKHLGSSQWTIQDGA